jgi:hypothetical protein
MERTSNVPPPPEGFEGSLIYSIRPRERRTFNTVLDARKILTATGRPVSHVRYSRRPDAVVVSMAHPIADGALTEELQLSVQPEGLVMRSMQREVADKDGVIVRREQVPDFRHHTLGLPTATYPEVALPFLLSWVPLDGERRSLYAWINDRFIAKVYVEVERTGSLSLAGGSREVAEVVMYPDLNDWVSLGAMLTRLAKPFVPKYRMWYERRAPFRLLRFEGPYGPPGAPEVILEAA